VTDLLTSRVVPAGSRIRGVGAFRPARIVYNDEICGPIDSTDEWIRKRSGIVSRHVAGPQETIPDMAVAAGTAALADAGVTAGDVDAVLVASMSYLYQSPPAAPVIAERLGAKGAAAFDIGAACAGFCHSLAVADALVRGGTARNVLVIGAERMTDIIDPKDRSTAFLFGDGAGAVLVGPAPDAGIGPVVWGSDGTRSDLVAHDDSWLGVRDKPEAWPYMRMSGPEVFRWAIQEVTAVARGAVEAAGVSVGDLAAFVPHQANARIIERMARDLRLGDPTAVARDVERSGNTSAASIPLALEALLTAEPGRSGGLALLIGFGSGLSHAAMVVRLP